MQIHFQLNSSFILQSDSDRYGQLNFETANQKSPGGYPALPDTITLDVNCEQPFWEPLGYMGKAQASVMTTFCPNHVAGKDTYSD